MELLVALLALCVGLLLGLLIGVLWARSRPGSDVGVHDGLERLHDQLRDLAHTRSSWQGQLSQQVADVRLAAEGLRQETQALATALRRPQVRGRWGELHLRRVVELAGLVDRCDFEEQVRLEDGPLRPDLVVHLAGGRRVVVDAKAPLEAFLDAAAATDEEARTRHLARHARAVRHHVDQLAAKRYWQAAGGSPEFVVLFLPAEPVLAAALEADRTLIEDASRRRVVLASPTTLIALLRTVAAGWTEERVAQHAREVQELGRDLHTRLSRMSDHLDRVGRSLSAAVGHYNRAVGSMETRVLVTARRLGELGLADTGPADTGPADTGPAEAGADPPMLGEPGPGDPGRVHPGPGGARRAEHGLPAPRQVERTARSPARRADPA